MNSTSSQTNFVGYDFYFDSGICDSLITNDDEEFLLLTFGNCDDKIQVNFSPTNSFHLETSGVYWSDSSKINLKISSQTKNIDINFEKVPDEDIIDFYIYTGHFSGIKTSYGEELFGGTIDTLRISGNGDFPEEEISIIDVMFYTQDSNSYFAIQFAGIPEVTTNQDTFYMNWIKLKLNSYIDSITQLDLSYSSLSEPTAITGFSTKVKKLDISWSPTEIKAGSSEIISGVGLDQLEGIFLNNEQIDFVLIDSNNIQVDWQNILPEYGDLIFVGAINSYLKKDVPLEEPFLTPTFDDFTSILFEDSSYTLYLKWEEPDSSFTGNYRINIKEKYLGEGMPTELYQTTIITTETEVVLFNLPIGEGFEVVLQKYNNSAMGYKHADFKKLNHRITDDLSFILAPKAIDLIMSWSRNSESIDMVTYLRESEIHQVAARALLQTLNNGKGFSSSSHPWYSNDGTLISLLSTPGTGPGPPEPPSLSDRDCLCRQLYTDAGIHSDGHNPSYGGQGWLMPRVSKHLIRNKKYNKNWMRTQKLGAAVYREIFTKRRYSGSRNNYFLNYDDNDENMPSIASPSQSYSTIQVSMICDAIVNGKIVYNPCRNICKTPSHITYEYNSQHLVEFRQYVSILNSYAKTFGSDEIFLVKEHSNIDHLDVDLIWGAMGAVEDHCSSSFDSDFVRVYGQFAQGIAKYIDFSEAGFNFDIDALLEDAGAISALYNHVADIIDQPFIKRNGNCDETTRKTELNTGNGTYNFEIGHGDTYRFTFYSRQRIGHRVLRARARTKIATDFHLLVNMGDVGYTFDEYKESREECCIYSKSFYIVGSHDTLYVGKNSIPDPDSPTRLEEDNIVVRPFYNHINIIESKIPHDLKILIGGSLPLDKNNLFKNIEDYLWCRPNSFFNTPPSTSLLLGNSSRRNISDEIRLFPNPVSYNDIHVDFLTDDKISGIKKLVVYDCIGRQIKVFELGTDSSPITDFLVIPNEVFESNGIYFIEVNLHSKTAIKPIIIQR